MVCARIIQNLSRIYPESMSRDSASMHSLVVNMIGGQASATKLGSKVLVSGVIASCHVGRKQETCCQFLD